MEKQTIHSSFDGVTTEYVVGRILEASPSPQDYYEVSALLESMGWNDARVQSNFGRGSVFELALEIWEKIKHTTIKTEFFVEEKIGFFKNALLMLKSFLRGLVFALPMAISVVAMLTLRFSLWSYQYLSTELATCIAIGTILSFVTIGGFTQAIARRGFFYTSQGFYNMARNVIFYLVLLGYGATILVMIAFILINMYYYNFEPRMMLIILAYYLFLSANWLAVTVMNVLRRQFAFTGLLTLGIAIVFVLFKVVGLNILVSQIISLFIVSAAGIALIVYYFHVEEHRKEVGIALQVPPRSIMLYSLGPYFAFGFFYFLMLFTDRIVAWSRDSIYMPYAIWFRGDYELGLDFALVMLIIPMGIIELLITELLTRLELTMKNSTKKDALDINKRYLRNYLICIVISTVAVILSALLVYFLVDFVRFHSTADLASTFYFNEVTDFVFYCSLLGYSFLTLGLMNTLIMFSLSQPGLCVKAITGALAVDFGVGFLLSRFISFEYAVLGLVLGTFTFMVLSTRSVLKLFKDLDYYLYYAL